MTACTLWLSNLPNLSLQVTHNYENFKYINNNEKKFIPDIYSM